MFKKIIIFDLMRSILVLVITAIIFGCTQKQKEPDKVYSKERIRPKEYVNDIFYHQLDEEPLQFYDDYDIREKEEVIRLYYIGDFGEPEIIVKVIKEDTSSKIISKFYTEGWKFSEDSMELYKPRRFNLKSRILTNTEWKELNLKLDSLTFRDLFSESGVLHDVINDGPHWDLEVVRGTKYWRVNKDGAIKDDRFFNFCIYLMRLSPLELEKDFRIKLQKTSNR